MLRKEQIDTFGALFRIITPILLGIIGYVSTGYLKSIDGRFESIDAKFNTFIESYHIIDKRVDRLETKVFGEKDYDPRNPRR